MNEDTVELVERFRQGDPQAADELFGRYVDRLRALVHVRLSAAMGRRIDADDVIQSAYRSFFVRARQGEYQLGGTGELWRLMVGITLNKLHGQIEHHTAGKRAIRAEESVEAAPGMSSVEFEALARDPSPDDAAALVEQIEGLMRGLSDVQRRMLELRLQGYQIAEIAVEVGRSERGVRRLLEKIKSQLRSPADETR